MSACCKVGQRAGGCFTNVSWALQNNLAKIHNVRNHIYGENFKLKLCTCAQGMALGTRTKFQLEILIRNTVSAIRKFQENILESSRNVSETNPRYLMMYSLVQHAPATGFHPLMSDKASNFTGQSITYSIDCLVGSWHTSPQSFAIPMIYATKSPDQWILGTRGQLG